MAHRQLYKYRGIEPMQYLLDILINQRLYASKFHQLNDPMEGIFTYSSELVKRRLIDRILENKDRLAICALSKVYNSTLMWSYYASAHKGIVIGVEIDLPTAPGVVAIEDVKYLALHKFDALTEYDPFTAAKRILSRKLVSWKHEQEVRVFTHSTYVPVAIRSIYLGCNMEHETVSLLSTLVHKVLPDVHIIQMDKFNLDRPVINYDT